MEKYSKSKLAAAEKFLADHQHTLDSLDEPQKKAVISYTNGRRYFALCFVVFISCSAVFISVAYVKYHKAYRLISLISENISSGEVLNADIYGTYCFKQGFLVGWQAFAGFVTLIYVILIPLLLRSKSQTITAFLPLLKQHHAQ
jgi:hypothetical protein